jgi:hypothetical protein
MNEFILDSKLENILNLKDDLVFIINDDLENQELRMNLCNIRKHERKVFLENIEYDRNLLLDSKICKLLKKERKIKYGKLLLFLRNDISKFFVPSEKEILNRLSRLDILGYIEKENDFYKYVE